MRNKIIAMIMIVIGILGFSGITSAITFIDADGDGILEVNEIITFYGDDSYVDSSSNEYPFTNWSWDFESDGIIDAYGKEANHSYSEKGTYIVTVYELGEVNVFTELKLKIVIPMPVEEDATYEQVLERSLINVTDLIENTTWSANETNYDKTDLEWAKFFLDVTLKKGGRFKLLQFVAVKFAVKNLENVNKRGIMNTTAIMEGLATAVKNKVESAIEEAETILSTNDWHVEKAWQRFDKGLMKLDEGRYSKAIEEFYKAFWAISCVV